MGTVNEDSFSEHAADDGGRANVPAEGSSTAPLDDTDSPDEQEFAAPSADEDSVLARFDDGDGMAGGEDAETPPLAAGDEGPDEDEPSAQTAPNLDETPAGSEEAPDAPSEPEDSAMLDPGQIAVADFFGPPRLDRPRLARPDLVPRWIILAATALVVVAVFWLGSLWWNSLSADIDTPKLVGVDVDTARVRLAEKGLKIAVAERRFSPQAKDTVLSQIPVAGAKLRSGDSVTVIVSAGSEQFPVPEVVGSGLLLARGLLQARGLDISVDAQPSQQPSDTVLASNPPAGTLVHTGDIIRLTVAAPGVQSSSLLLPYEMKGVTVLIDPAPVSDPLSDAPLDVARRLRALVEASHGKVVTTRALADTSTVEVGVARAQKAAAASATVAIGLSTIDVGGAGLVVWAPSPVLPYATSSSKLASLITSDLASRTSTVKASTLSSDSVLVGARCAWVRVQLGSLSQREDVARFKDPAWEDSVARALYKGIAARYGRKTSASQ